jgi:hypothetical protein
MGDELIECGPQHNKRIRAKQWLSKSFIVWYPGQDITYGKRVSYPFSKEDFEVEYTILRAGTIYWHNQEVRAKLQSPYDMQVAIDLWNPDPFTHDPLQEYTVNGKAPLPDPLRTGSIAWLMSKRLPDLLRYTGVQFEGFQVKLYDRKSRELVPKHYQLFHLLQVQPVIDLQSSNITGYEHIDQIE